MTAANGNVLPMPARAPQWLIEMCGQPRRAEATAAVPIEADPEQAVPRAVDYLEHHAPVAYEGEGGDDTTYRVAAQVKDFGVDEATCLELMLEHWNERCEPPWDPDALEQKVVNAYRYGTRPLGASSPEADFEAVEVPGEGQGRESAYQADNAGGLLEKLRDSWTAPERRPEALRETLSVTYLIRGVLPENASVLLYGQPKRGKTFLTLDMAMAVATGREWHGKPVKQAPVLYIAGEGRVSILQRQEAWLRHHGLEDVGDFHLIGRRVRLDSPRELGALRAFLDEVQAAMGRPFGLIIIDTVKRCMSGDENSSQDMDRFNAACDAIQHRTGATVLAVHHSGKDESRGPRGSNVLTGAVDLELHVKRRKKTGPVKLVCEEARNSGEFDPLVFDLQPVDTELADVDGQPVRSLVPTRCRLGAPEDPADEFVESGGPLHITPPHELKAAARKALTILRSLTPMDVHREGPGRLRVPLSEWRDSCLQHGLSEGKSESSQRVAFSRAKDELLNAGLILSQGDTVTLIWSSDEG